MSKGTKLIKQLLNSYSHPYGEDFSGQRNIYYDLVVETQNNIQSNIEANSSKGMDKLKLNVESLKEKNKLVSDVLEDVELVTKYDD